MGLVGFDLIDSPSTWIPITEFGILINYILRSLNRYVSNSLWPEKVFEFEATQGGFYFIHVVYNLSSLLLCTGYYEFM